MKRFSLEAEAKKKNEMKKKIKHISQIYDEIKTSGGIYHHLMV